MCRTTNKYQLVKLVRIKMVTLQQILANINCLLKIRTHYVKSFILSNCKVKLYFLSILVFSKITEVGYNIIMFFERKLILNILCVCLHGISKNLLFLFVFQITIYVIVFSQIRNYYFINNSIIQILSSKIVVSLCIEYLHNTIFHF